MSMDFNAWNKDVIAEFRANGGKVGGMFEGAPIAIVHTKGAKSGLERLNPLVALIDGDRIYVIASKGGGWSPVVGPVPVRVVDVNHGLQAPPAGDSVEAGRPPAEA